VPRGPVVLVPEERKPARVSKLTKEVRANGKIRQEVREEGRAGDARDEAWQAQERPLGQESNEQETSDRNRTLRSSRRRRQGAFEEGRQEGIEKGFEERIEEAFEQEGFEEAIVEEAYFKEEVARAVKTNSALQ